MCVPQSLVSHVDFFLRLYVAFALNFAATFGNTYCYMLPYFVEKNNNLNVQTHWILTWRLILFAFQYEDETDA